MQDINGFKVTESKDKIKIFTKNLNIKKLVELIRNLIKDNTFFVQVNYEGNYSPMKKVNSIQQSNIPKFIKELKTIAFKYKDGLYNVLSIMLKQNNYKKYEKMPNLFDGEINWIVKILKALYPKQDDQETSLNSKA